MARWNRPAHARVDAAREPQDDPVVAHLLLELGDGALDKRGCAPLLAAAAYVDHKVLEQLLALCGVEHLGVKLHGPHGLVGAGIGAHGVGGLRILCVERVLLYALRNEIFIDVVDE